MRHPLRLGAAVLAATALGIALAGPPVVPLSQAAPRPEESSGFRYLPAAAFGITQLTRVTGVESMRWDGTFSPGERFELLSERLPTGRYYLLYSISGAVEAASPARLECGLSEAESGIPLVPQPTLTLRSGDGLSDQETGAVFDLPGMQIALTCTIDSLAFGSIDIERAELSVFETP